MRMLYNEAQTDIRSVFDSVVEQVMWDLKPKDVIGETLDAHIANFFDTNAAAEGLSKRLLASSPFMVPIATFMRRRTDTALKENNYSTAFVSIEPVDTVQTYNDDNEPLPSRLDRRRDEVSRREPLKCR